MRPLLIDNIYKSFKTWAMLSMNFSPLSICLTCINFTIIFFQLYIIWMFLDLIDWSLSFLFPWVVSKEYFSNFYLQHFICTIAHHKHVENYIKSSNSYDGPANFILHLWVTYIISEHKKMICCGHNAHFIKYFHLI